MRRIDITLSFLVLGLAAFTSVALAGVLQKPGFSLSLPDGWVEVPQDVLTTMHEELSRQAPNAQIPKYDYAFQRGTAKNWLEYPYVLVQVSNVGRIPEHKLKSMPKIDMNEKFSSKAADVKSLMSNVEFGQTQYDEAAHVIWINLQTDVAGIGKVQGLSGLIPTEKGLLQLHGYSIQSNFQDYVSTFRQIVKSAVVSPDLAYKPRWTDSSPILSGIDWGQVMVKAISGAIIGGLVWLVAGLWRKKKGS